MPNITNREKTIIYDLVKDEVRCLQAMLDEEMYESDEERAELERDIAIHNNLLAKVT